MWKRFPLRLALLTLIATASLPLTSRAQSQDSSAPSVAEAARRAQRLKKKSDKPVPVLTEDNLKPAPPVSTAPAGPAENPVVSPPTPNPPADSTAPLTDSVPPAAASKSGDNLKALKKQLVEAQKDLELVQLDLSLQQDTYFSNPDYIHDKDGKAKIDAKQLDVTEKEQIVDRLKIKIAALEGPQNPSSTSSPTRP